jgi:hypothetical protein
MSDIMNFRPHEFIRTDTGIENFPDSFDLWKNIIDTAHKINEVRTKFGAPIAVDCGYRSPAVNNAVGGVPTSAHLAGLAADIRAYDGLESSNRALFSILLAMLEKIGIDQLIMYNVVPCDKTSKVRFFHVGFREPGARPRNQVLYK